MSYKTIDTPAKRGPKPKAKPAPVAVTDETGFTNHTGDDTPSNPDPVIPPTKGRIIPPCPCGDPAMGMKSPEVVAWWFKHYPEEAKARYAGLTFDHPEI